MSRRKPAPAKPARKIWSLTQDQERLIREVIEAGAEGRFMPRCGWIPDTACPLIEDEILDVREVKHVEEDPKYGQLAYSELYLVVTLRGLEMIGGAS